MWKLNASSWIPRGKCGLGKRFTMVRVRQGLFIIECLHQKSSVFCDLEENTGNYAFIGFSVAHSGFGLYFKFLISIHDLHHCLFLNEFKYWSKPITKNLII